LIIDGMEASGFVLFYFDASPTHRTYAWFREDYAFRRAEGTDGGAWARLMRGYAERMGISIPAGQAEAALVWEEPFRDTALGRSAAQRIFAEGRDIYCAWSATKLRPSRLDIDHCMPWSAWPCGDLWNLLPSERRVNQHQKRERLPSGELLLNSRERIIGWWNDAWLSSPTLSQRFWREASAALFVAEPSEPEQLFAGLEWRRLRLRQDQLVPEWTGEQRVWQA